MVLDGHVQGIYAIGFSPNGYVIDVSSAQFKDLDTHAIIQISNRNRCW